MIGASAHKEMLGTRNAGLLAVATLFRIAQITNVIARVLGLVSANEGCTHLIGLLWHLSALEAFGALEHLLKTTMTLTNEELKIPSRCQVCQ